jgi:hypothetical protein
VQGPEAVHLVGRAEGAALGAQEVRRGVVEPGANLMNRHFRRKVYRQIFILGEETKNYEHTKIWYYVGQHADPQHADPQHAECKGADRTLTGSTICQVCTLTVGTFALGILRFGA